ncbi:MAG: hypothetical protein JOZ78_10905 [Chroococcidiopsidaceae cyanobacterium CP_BM_ER_R8_30]|nr:hypothetical protein [Chroococcidiopsidaceae cyanobacterium CP_BM_ER_R8_30]
MQEVKERPDISAEVKESYYYAGTKWHFGFTPSAEIWNGRLAMIGFFMTLLIEVIQKDGLLGGLVWGLFS